MNNDSFSNTFHYKQAMIAVEKFHLLELYMNFQEVFQLNES